MEAQESMEMLKHIAKEKKKKKKLRLDTMKRNSLTLAISPIPQSSTA